MQNRLEILKWRIVEFLKKKNFAHNANLYMKATAMF
jgi:hypothetical protein